MYLKKILPLLVILLPFAVLSLWYVSKTMVDTIFLDGFLHTPLIAQFLEGQMTVQELIGPFFGEHLLAGYRILTILNLKYFSLDARFDSVVFVCAFGITCVLVYFENYKIYPREKSLLLGLTFFPLAFLCFSLVAPPLLLMSTQFASGTAVAFLIAFVLQRNFDYLKVSRIGFDWPWIGSFLLIPVYFLLFGGAYFPGMLFGLAAMYLFRGFIENKWIERNTLTIAIWTLLCALAYVYVMLEVRPENIRGASLGSGQSLDRIIFLVLFYLVGIGSSLIDQHTVSEGQLGQYSAAIFGAGMTVITGTAIYLFVNTKMYLKSYLPIYCIFYPVGIITIVCIGRSGLNDWAWISNNWYSFHLRFLVLGVVWICIYTLVWAVRGAGVQPNNSPKSRYAKGVFSILALVYIFSIQAFSNQAQWQRGPYVAAWLIEKRNALCIPDLFNRTTNILLWPEVDITESREILKRYSLSCFSSRQWKNFPETGLARVTGWHDDNWVGGKAAALYRTKLDTTLTFHGYTPAKFPKNHLEVKINGAVIYSEYLIGGTAFSFSSPVRKGSNVIAISTTNPASPQALGINQDSRLLSLELSVQPMNP